ncbi:hypothetical protein C4K68_19930 [Pokkaliibacter plantistimulans]|uniref:DUF2846 domain-containing protein n=1 Tax=Proteobacteria bacterium 228 TaxID=2083153 RepID=A0A2S5KLQ2_9PROT|nr:DUF2846 domain-containing protein [Pokkaliibacter plantistimulans]PPC75575.1 hypothetical protein C4K68_19930 [Pokkaliibacter plantistimulans]
MFRKSIAAVALVTLVTGCASVPMANKEEDGKFKSFPQPDAGNAGIYVYRNSMFGSALKKDIWIDDKCVGESASGIYFYLQVKGDETHKISTESEFSANDLLLKTDAGKNYYVKQYIKPGLLVGGANLKQVDEPEAQAAIAKLQLAQPGKCSK